ncbi:PA2169 family four-helix-bundle protein [soil metagenome]
MDNNDVVDTLNKLIETSKDGEYGFTSCAEHVKSTNLKSLFTQRAGECRQAAAELQALVANYGEKPDTGGTVGGAMHRGWVAVKGTLSGYSEEAVLNECERGEDVAKAAYQKAIDKGLPPEVATVVTRQYEGVLRNHKQVRTLRDAARAAS